MSLTRTALHEAAHGVVLLGGGYALKRLSIVSTETTRGICVPAEGQIGGGLFRAVYDISGAVAEQIAFGREGDGCWLDLALLRETMERASDALGIMPWEWKPAVEQAARSYLRENWNSILRLVAVLFDERELDGQRAAKVAGGVTTLDLSMIENSIRHWQGRIAAREPAAR